MIQQKKLGYEGEDKGKDGEKWRRKTLTTKVKLTRKKVKGGEEGDRNLLPKLSLE